MNLEKKAQYKANLYTPINQADLTQTDKENEQVDENWPHL